MWGDCYGVFQTSESTQPKMSFRPWFTLQKAELGHHNTGAHLKQESVAVCVFAPASYLPAEVPVVHVTHKQRLGGEGVRLDLDIRTGDLVDETAKDDFS